MVVNCSELSSSGHVPACKHTLIPKKLCPGIRLPAPYPRLNSRLKPTNNALGQSASVKVSCAPVQSLPPESPVLPLQSKTHQPVSFFARLSPYRRRCTNRNFSRQRKSTQNSASPMWSHLVVRGKEMEAGMRVSPRSCTAGSRCGQLAARHTRS